MTTIDECALAGVTGGTHMYQCRSLSKAAKALKRGGETADSLDAQFKSEVCRARFRREYPNPISKLYSYF